ncbi:MAG: M56 family metallopeptidase [Terriglobales bacterium]
MIAALGNHLWQSTLVTLLAAAVALALRGGRARVRFGVWLAASVKYLVPFSALAAAGAWIPWPAARAAAAPPAALAAASLPIGTLVFTDSGASRATTISSVAPWLLGAVWLLGALVVAWRWWRSWRYWVRVANAARPARIEGAEVWLTEGAREPGLFGILHPRLLVPRELLLRLDAGAMAAMLAHERAHQRRRDNLWAALQMLVQTLFWFDPLVWLIGARLLAEREPACDEAALRGGGDCAAYAGGLLAVCRYSLNIPVSCAAGLGGGDLKRRVREITSGNWGQELSRTGKLALGALGAVALLGPLAAGVVYWQAPSLPAAFDAASIKPSPPRSLSGRKFTMHMGITTSPGRLTADNTPLKTLIQDAYGLKPYQVQMPPGYGEQRFDVRAETQQPLDRDQLLHLLQGYLVQQFGLKYHDVNTIVPVYDLVAAAGGLKVKPVPANAPQASANSGIRIFFNRKEGAAEFSMNVAGPRAMERLADILSMQLDRPVIDKTGLTGTYNFTLSYAPTGMGPGLMLMRPGQPVVNGKAVKTDPSAPSIFSALTDQAGLKLEPAQGPIAIMVIDHANSQPLGN